MVNLEDSEVFFTAGHRDRLAVGKWLDISIGINTRGKEWECYWCVDNLYRLRFKSEPDCTGFRLKFPNLVKNISPVDADKYCYVRDKAR